MRILSVLAMLLSFNCFAGKRKPASAGCSAAITSAMKMPMNDAFFPVADKTIANCAGEMVDNGTRAQRMATTAVLGICREGTFGEAGAGGAYNEAVCKLKAYEIGLLVNSEESR